MTYSSIFNILFDFDLILGPSELALYTVIGVKYCKKKLKHYDEEVNGLLVEILFERPIMGNILTQFLPTTLFLIIRDFFFISQIVHKIEGH